MHLEGSREDLGGMRRIWRDLEGCGVVLEGPGMDLERSGVDLEGSGVDLEGSAVVI